MLRTYARKFPSGWRPLPAAAMHLRDGWGALPSVPSR